MPDNDERFLEEYRKVFQDYARLDTDYQEMVDPLREALKTSATLIMSSNPETVETFRNMVKEIDAFLAACQTGDVTPERFVFIKKPKE